MHPTSARDDNPYAPPRTPNRPGDRLSQSEPQPAAGQPRSLSITHDLTDDELKRFYGFDFFYDPVPLFGFIPQWIWLIPVIAAIGFVHGLGMMHSVKAGMVESPVVALIVTILMMLLIRYKRATVRSATLCEKRTLTITAKGLTLKFPLVVKVARDMATLGPQNRRWVDVREVESTKADIVFWLKGRDRLLVPRRAFPTMEEADRFLQAATEWHADAV